MKAAFPIQPELTAIAIAYKNRSLIADQVLPRVPVGKQDFKYLKFNLADGFTLPDTKVGRKSAPNRVEFTATEITDSCVDYALDDPIPNADIENAPPNFNPINVAVEGIMDLIKLDREVRTANLVFDYTNSYGSSNKETLAGTTQFSDYVNSNPIGVLTTAIDSMVMRPNKIIMGQAVWTKLRMHPKLVQAVFGNNQSTGILTREQFLSLFELDELLVGASFLNSAKKGQTPTLGRVWGKHIVLCYSNQVAAASGRTTFGFTAQWGTPIAGSEFDKNIGMRGGEIVRAGESVKEVIAATDLGYMIKDAVA